MEDVVGEEPGLNRPVALQSHHMPVQRLSWISFDGKSNLLAHCWPRHVHMCLRFFEHKQDCSSVLHF